MVHKYYFGLKNNIIIYLFHKKKIEGRNLDNLNFDFK